MGANITKRNQKTIEDAMSFLHEDKVLAQLLAPLVKQGQDAAVVDVARKMVSQLEKQYSGAPNITAANDIELKPENISNLSQLLQFLEANRVSVDGKRLVYRDLASVPADERDNYATPIPVISRDPQTRKQITGNLPDYQVNLPLMTKYLSHLQQKAVTDNNRVLAVMIGRTIEEYNQYNPESGLSRKPKPPSDELSPDTELDNFSLKVFDRRAVGVDQGPIFLTVKDMQSRESFNVWLQDAGGKEAQIVPYDEKGQPAGKPISYTANPCDVFNAMSFRANRKLQQSRSPEETKASNYYVKRVHELAATFAGPDGKACQITTAPSATSTEKTPATEGAQSVDQSIAHAVATLPFSAARIDFNQINDFFNQVKNLMSNNGQVMSNIDAAQRSMAAASSLTELGDTIFNLDETPKGVMDRLKNKTFPAKDYPALLNHLSEVINYARQVIVLLYSTYSTRLAPNQKAAIEGHMGRSPTDNSFYARNQQELQRLRNSVSRVQT